MITKENYEIWMVDMMDGKLSEAQQEELMLFLAAHPEYDVDISDLDMYTLKADDIQFSDKTELLKSEADEFGLNILDYEAITAVEENQKQSNDLIETYRKTILKPDNSIRFAQKDYLKRALILPFMSKQRFAQIATAASVALLFGLGTTLWFKAPVEVKPTAAILQTSIKNQQQNNLLKTIEPISKTKKSEVKSNKIETSELSSEIPENKHIISREDIQKMTPKSTLQLNTTKVNGYEAGLNNMMPYVIAYNLKKKVDAQELAFINTQQQSEKLARTEKVITNGAKVINFLSGNDTTIKKYLNENGQLIAYEVESEGISFTRKIKNSKSDN